MDGSVRREHFVRSFAASVLVTEQFVKRTSVAMRFYWIPSATLILDSPLQLGSEEPDVSAYTRSYYLAAGDLDRASVVLEAAARAEGASLLAHEPIEEVLLERVPQKRREPWDGVSEGVLWRTGRVFFPES